MWAEPEEGGNKPVSIDIVVVLPAPLCPSRAVIWPLKMFKDSSSTATLDPVEVFKVKTFKILKVKRTKTSGTHIDKFTHEVTEVIQQLIHNPKKTLHRDVKFTCCCWKILRSEPQLTCIYGTSLRYKGTFSDN